MDELIAALEAGQPLTIEQAGTAISVLRAVRRVAEKPSEVLDGTNCANYPTHSGLLAFILLYAKPDHQEAVSTLAA